jgi:hypothetical protein
VPGSGEEQSRPSPSAILVTTTDEQYGTPEHGRAHHRRALAANPSNAVVVRQWHGPGYGPAGQTVCLTNAAVEQPLQPVNASAERSRIENCCIEAAKQQWELGAPPQKIDRAVRVHGLFLLRMFGLATADRLPCEHEDPAGEPVGWQRGRRQLLERTRDHVRIVAQGCYGILHMAE